MVSALRSEYYLTPEEYLAGERISQEKHEYLAGVVYAMAGATEAHNVISQNISGALWQQLRNRRCRAFAADYKVRIRTGAAEFYYYPDVMIDCAEFQGKALFSEEPRVIFEVSSPDTERTDRAEKKANYQSISTLDVYVVVNQFQLDVTLYRRTGDGWVMEYLNEASDVLELPTVECSLPLSTIYERTRLLR